MNCDERVSAHQRLTRKECMTPPNPDEVIVRFVSAQISPDRLNRPGRDRLGDAYVDTSAASGTLATVYVDRVAVMARSAGLDAGTLARPRDGARDRTLAPRNSRSPAFGAHAGRVVHHPAPAPNRQRLALLDARCGERARGRPQAGARHSTDEDRGIVARDPAVPRFAQRSCSSDMSDVPDLRDVPTSRSGALSPARRAKPLTARSNRGSRTRPSIWCRQSRRAPRATAWTCPIDSIAFSRCPASLLS